MDDTCSADSLANLISELRGREADPWDSRGAETRSRLSYITVESDGCRKTSDLTLFFLNFINS